MTSRTPLRTGKLWPRLKRRLGVGGRALVAVSGGADSMGMLHLVLPPEELRDRLVVGYVHHGTGDHADDAEALVREFAGHHSLEFAIQQVAVTPEMKKEQGFEAGARALRYSALRKIAEAEGCSLILTGHTADDSAESLLLYMMRGAGVSGLIGAREDGGSIFRPVLNFRHDELVRFLEELGVRYIEDPSNMDRRMTRNRIRHEIKPVLVQQFGAGAWKNMSRTSRRLEEAEDVLSAVADDAFRQVLKRRSGHWLLLDAMQLFQYLADTKRRVLLSAWNLSVDRSSGSIRELGWAALGRMLRLLDTGDGTSEMFPGGVRATRTDKHLVLDGYAETPEMTWGLPGEITLADGTLLVAERLGIDQFTGISEDPGRVEYMDAGVVGDSLTVRPRRDGDRFESLGKPGSSVKISRLLSGHGVRRDGPVWIVTHENEPVFLPGYRIAHRVRVQPETENVYRVTCRLPDETKMA